MPVLTRARSKQLQEEAERLANAEEPQKEDVNFSPNKTTDSNRNRKQKRRSMGSSLTEKDSKSLSRNDKKRIGDQFRNDLNSYMGSPQKENANGKKKIVRESPRVDRITMQPGTSQAMEFLVPPKEVDDPIEIRQQIRESLNFDKEVPESLTRGSNINANYNHPNANGQEEEHPLKDSMLTPPKRTSPYPVWNEETKAWTPNSPSFDKQRANRVSTMLVIMICCVLIAVFIGVYQNEIVQFTKDEVIPMGNLAVDSMKQSMEQSMKSIQTMYYETIEKFGNEELDNNNDTVIENQDL